MLDEISALAVRHNDDDRRRSKSPNIIYHRFDDGRTRHTRSCVPFFAPISLVAYMFMRLLQSVAWCVVCGVGRPTLYSTMHASKQGRSPSFCPPSPIHPHSAQERRARCGYDRSFQHGACRRRDRGGLLPIKKEAEEAASTTACTIGGGGCHAPTPSIPCCLFGC